jgi:hypothetical protein
MTHKPPVQFRVQRKEKKYFFSSLLKFLSAYGTINPKIKKSEPPGERKHKADCRLLVQIGNRGRNRQFPHCPVYY